MSTSCDGLHAATIILVAISTMWATTFMAEASGLSEAPALVIGALAAFAASDAYARIAGREVPRPHGLFGPTR